MNTSCKFNENRRNHRLIKKRSCRLPWVDCTLCVHYMWCFQQNNDPRSCICNSANSKNPEKNWELQQGYSPPTVTVVTQTKLTNYKAETKTIDSNMFSSVNEISRTERFIGWRRNVGIYHFHSALWLVNFVRVTPVTADALYPCPTGY